MNKNKVNRVRKELGLVLISLVYIGGGILLVASRGIINIGLGIIFILVGFGIIERWTSALFLSFIISIIGILVSILLIAVSPIASLLFKYVFGYLLLKTALTILVSAFIMLIVNGLILWYLWTNRHLFLKGGG